MAINADQVVGQLKGGHSKKRIVLPLPMKSLYWVKLPTEVSAS